MDAGLVAAVVTQGFLDAGVERGEEGERVVGRGGEMMREPLFEERNRRGPGRRERGREGETLVERVGERERARGRSEEEIERVYIEGLDEELRADFEDIGNRRRRVIRPIEGVARRVAGGDEFGVGR